MRRGIKIQLRYWSKLGHTAISYYTLDQVGLKHCFYVVGSPGKNKLIGRGAKKYIVVKIIYVLRAAPAAKLQAGADV